MSMKLYVSFGGNHVHKIDGIIFDNMCLASIDCDDYEHGRSIAFEIFGEQFCTTYDDTNVQKRYFPRGVIPIPKGVL